VVIGLDGHDGYANVEVGTDESGPYAVLGCDEPGCEAHESVRPQGDPREVSAHEMAATVMDWAITDGWLVNEDGQWCPQHA
jgi:hypothetical protein